MGEGAYIVYPEDASRYKEASCIFAFFPFTIEQFDLRGYDVIISSSHCVAKGVLTKED